MLGLPSTTEVSQRIPKEAFYRNMDLDARTREQFVSGVDRIVVRNAIRPDTANIASGERVREILVVEVTPKAGEVPEAVAQTVLRANPNPMVVTDGSTGRVWARSTGRTVTSDGLATLSLAGPTMDEAWDSILAQVAFREEDGSVVGDFAYEAVPRTFSKMKVVAALTEEGVWEDVKAWIEGAGLYDIYLAAQDFAEDNEHFAQGKAQLQAALGWSDERVEALLAQCVTD